MVRSRDSKEYRITLQIGILVLHYCKGFEMLIHFGRKETELVNEQLFGVNCPECGNSGRLSITIVARYVHMFWIPLFSIGRTGFSYCGSCRQELNKRNMPGGLQHAYQDVLRSTSIPWWHFSGLILVGVLFLIGLITTYIPK
ncbi:MAG: hypothetical protein JNJ85_05170 [Candidatus Kapabacteria bacterium]|nr:hypothetical protein [Candidatus Kapabacteria bacterium]MBX7154930.1 zinc ribbon domain-containing protein [Bacteroidota bacterium]